MLVFAAVDIGIFKMVAVLW